MVGHGGSSAGLYLADPTSSIPSHCASIVVTSTVRVNKLAQMNLWYISQAIRMWCIFDDITPHQNAHYRVSTCNDQLIMSLLTFHCFREVFYQEANKMIGQHFC